MQDIPISGVLSVEGECVGHLAPTLVGLLLPLWAQLRIITIGCRSELSVVLWWIYDHYADRALNIWLYVGFSMFLLTFSNLYTIRLESLNQNEGLLVYIMGVKV